LVATETISLRTNKRSQWVDITPAIEAVVEASTIQNGICVAASLHTTGGITINENADPDVERDFFYKLDALIPQDSAYHHAEGNSDSHLKTSLVGLSVQISVSNGKIIRGTWQSIYFCEFDGPRHRNVSVTIIGE
jgi:secondary thiamine-phosphate synthase enzyme